MQHITEVPALAAVAQTLAPYLDGTWSWEPSGQRSAQLGQERPFVLIPTGREEMFYSFHATKADALKWLAEGISEGSYDFYEGDAYIVDSRDQDLTIVDGIGVNGLSFRAGSAD